MCERAVGSEPDFVAAKIEEGSSAKLEPFDPPGSNVGFRVSCDYGRAPVDLHIAIVESERMALEHFRLTLGRHLLPFIDRRCARDERATHNHPRRAG